MDETAQAAEDGGAPAHRPGATGMNASWSMDFVSDGLFNGRRFRS